MSGLSNIEVQDRINKGLVNHDPQDISPTIKQIIIKHTFTYFNFINLLLGIVVSFTGKYQNMTFLGVVIINALIGIIQEIKIKKTIDQLTLITKDKVKVIRENQELFIDSEAIVLDDLICIEAGNAILTDGKIEKSYGLEVNESMLTGESNTIEKYENDLIYAGTFVVSGKAYYHVTHVGEANYANQIISKAKDERRAHSIMKETITKVIRIISYFIIPVGLLLYYSQYRILHEQNAAILQSVGGIVGMIPEGLVLLTSLSFVLGVGRLAKKRALVQQMEAIESLAHIDTLCLDKTGTITTGDLKVKYVIPIQEEINLDTLIGTYSKLSSGNNVTDKALRNYFHQYKQTQIQEEIPFSSSRKYSIIKFNDTYYGLGAPEFLTNNQEVLEQVNAYSELSLRCLLFVQGERNQDHLENIKELGLIVLSDILKEDAFDTLQYLKNESIRIKVLSGDNPLTVSRVCANVGIDHSEAYFDARNLPEEKEKLIQVVENYHIFGRVKPEQKQKIVEALQASHTVGMIGDGVNDVLAIKQADCGLAMANGSDALKHAAHIVLVDSKFESLKEILSEGRNIITNIEKVSSLYLNKTIFSLTLSILFSIFGLMYPFTPFQLSLISAFGIGIPSFIITMTKSEYRQDGFFHHIKYTALPCSLTIITYSITLSLLSLLSIITSKEYISYNFIIANFVSVYVLYLVLKPLNKYKFILLLLMTCISYSMMFLFYPYYEIMSLFQLSIYKIIIFIIIGLILLHVYQIVIRRISHE